MERDIPASEYFAPDIPMVGRSWNRPLFIEVPGTIVYRGYELKAEVVPDEDMGPPWKEHDGHGPVSEWRSRSSKRPGERILCEYRGHCRFYDFAEAVKIARKDKWDAPPYGTGTPGERAVRAVERDFEWLRAWCNDEWHWVIVKISARWNGVPLDEWAASLGGIDSDAGDDEFTSTANELRKEAYDAARTARKRLRKRLGFFPK